MFNSIQLFGLVLLGGLAAGEVSRRSSCLAKNDWLRAVRPAGRPERPELGNPFSHRVGTAFHRSGAWVDSLRTGIPGSAQHPGSGSQSVVGRLCHFLMAGLLVLPCFSTGVFYGLRVVCGGALCCHFAAITIATCSDVGAKGERTGLLYTMVAINGAVAFAAWSCCPVLDR
jgi:hypothetical protein